MALTAKHADSRRAKSARLAKLLFDWAALAEAVNP